MATVMHTPKGLKLSNKGSSRGRTCRPACAPAGIRAPLTIKRCTLRFSAYRDQSSGGGGALPDSPYAQQPKPAAAGHGGLDLVDLYGLDPEGLYADTGVKVRREDLAVLTEPGDKLVHFRIPVAGPGAKTSDLLRSPTIRHLLQPFPSNLNQTLHTDGRFVSDDDRVALNVMHFGSPKSTGAKATWALPQASPPAAVPLSAASAGPRAGARGGVGTLPVVHVEMPTFGIRAGPRETIYFEPSKVTAAIVVVGGICPGINDVIQNLVSRLHAYGVPEGNVLGIKYGVRGFLQKDCKPVVLTVQNTDGIHLNGGATLGTATVGTEEMQEDTPQFQRVANKLRYWGIDMLFVIGGEGGIKMTAEMAQWCNKEKVACSIIAVPKSIENDVLLVDRCFGFETVVQEAERPLQAAKTEASSARKGVGLVKLMGRRSGFIAMQASLASGVVDVCLIPEVPFLLDGPNGLLTYLKQLMDAKGHVVVCVAEGAGQDLLYSENEHLPLDERGNPVLRDIGKMLKKKIKEAIPDADIKYIDPTYMIQAVPCNSLDHIYTKTQAYHAVDAAFAGYTGTVIGQVNSHSTFLPAPVLTLSPRRVDPHGKQWNRLRGSIGQPQFQEPAATAAGGEAAPSEGESGTESGAEFNGFAATAKVRPPNAAAAAAAAGVPAVELQELPRELTPFAPAAHGAAPLATGQKLAAVRPKGLSLEEQVMERERHRGEWRKQMQAVREAQEAGGRGAAAAGGGGGGDHASGEQKQQQQQSSSSSS